MVGRLPVRTCLSNVRVRLIMRVSFRNLASEYTWYCPSTHHRLGRLATEVRTPVADPRVEKGQSASLDVVDCSAVAGAETSADLETSFDDETLKEPDTPSYVAY